MTPTPLHLLPGPPRHGVTRYARELADALGARVATRLESVPDGASVHLHLTDRVLDDDPARAARRVDRLGRRTHLTVTLHDVPQPGDGASFERRAAAYRLLMRACRGWATNSEHERALLETHCRARSGAGAVIHLPVTGPLARTPLPPAPDAPTVGVLGFVYPGKGHREVLEALGASHVAGPRPGLVVLGRAAPGHQDELLGLRRRAAELGVPLRVTGYLEDDELERWLRTVTVGVAGHRNVSASGSVNSWLAAGRRPLVRSSRYARELERLRPGAHQLFEDEELGETLDRALGDPGLTWQPPDVDLGPGLDEVAARYRAWWGSLGMGRSRVR